MDTWRRASIFPVPGQSAIVINPQEGSTVRIRSMNSVFAVTTAALLTFPLATAVFGQAAPPAAQQGQQGQQGGGRGGRGGRGGQAAAPAAPTPRRADGKPILGSVPG